MNIKNLRKTQGFTLIELMIVIAIIAILAAIALPAYQNYTIRSKVSEAILAGDACKTSVAEYYQSQGTLPAGLSASGCTNSTSPYVSSLGVTTGTITVAVSSATGTTGDYILKPDTSKGTAAPISWNCTTSSVPAQYLPAICR